MSVFKKLFHRRDKPQSFDLALCNVEWRAKPHISTIHPPPKQNQ